MCLAVGFAYPVEGETRGVGSENENEGRRRRRYPGSTPQLKVRKAFRFASSGGSKPGRITHFGTAECLPNLLISPGSAPKLSVRKASRFTSSGPVNRDGLPTLGRLNVCPICSSAQFPHRSLK
jgi:hypothetical protein